MKETYKSVVSRRLEELQRNKFTAARSADLEKGFLNDLLIERKKSVQGENFDKLAAALDWAPTQLTEALDGRWPSASPPASAHQARGGSQPMGNLNSQELSERLLRQCAEAAIETVFSVHLGRLPRAEERESLVKSSVRLFEARQVLEHHQSLLSDQTQS